MMKKLMAELVSKLSKIDTNMTKVSEFSKIKIDLTKYNVSYMFMRGLYNFRYGEHFGFSVSHTTRQPRPGRKKTLNGRYLNNILHDHDNIIIKPFIKIIYLPLSPSLIFRLSLFDWIIIMVITGEEDGKDYHFVTR